MKTTHIFRPLEKSECEEAYGIISDTTEWLLAKGINQWSVPIPKFVIEKRQANRSLYGLFDTSRMIATVCLLPQHSTGWKIDAQSFTFIATLAIASDYHGKKIGALCMTKALDYLTTRGVAEAYLDCMDHQGILPAFYRSFGFSKIDRKTDVNGRVDVLLKRRL